METKFLVWKEAGFNSKEVYRWNSNGFSLEEARLWKKYGFEARDAAIFKDKDMLPSEAKALIIKGLKEGL